MKELLHLIPGRYKDIGCPERYLCATEEFVMTANKFNGRKKKLYFSVFDCNAQRDFNGADLHTIFFDLDSSNGLQNVEKLWHYCKEHNYKCLLTFSTNGFWCFIFTKNYQQLINRKDALKQAQQHICNELGLTIGKGKECDVDIQVIGDIARIARLPNGYDITRKRFCIPITIEDIQQGYEFIKEKSKEQCFTYVYYNNGYLDISKFDSKIIPKEEVIPYIEQQYVDCDIGITKSFLPCIQYWLDNPEVVTNRIRYYFAVYCRDFGLSPETCNTIARTFWSGIKDSKGAQSKYDEFVNEKQINCAYKKQYPHPNCNKVIQEGGCPGKCSKYKETNFPLYK